MSSNQKVTVSAMSARLYILLGVLLFIATFGLTGLFVVPASILCFLAGFVYISYQKGIEKCENLDRDFDTFLKSYKFQSGIEQLLKNKDRYDEQNQYTEVHSMSNSPTLDPVLEQILSFITRDYIGSWYKNITNDVTFEQTLKRTSRRSIASLVQCLRQVEWVPLITRDVVDDFASHLRLFRKAKERTLFQMAEQKKDDKSARKKESENDELLSNFFDFELEMEKSLCRDLLSTTPHYENAYLHDLVDIILYLIMPPEDFRCRPLRFLLREVLVRKVILPTLDYLSDPNEIFQLIVWLLSEVEPKPDDFTACIANSTSIEELEAIYKNIMDEKVVMRGKDSGGEQDTFVKQQLASLKYVEDLIKQRIDYLASKSSSFAMKFGEDHEQLVQLPIHVILTNSTALSQFCEFLKSAGGQNYIDLYLAIEGFKSSVEHQMRSITKGELSGKEAYETVKEAAKFMYDQYLSQEAITRVPLEDSLVSRFLMRLKNDEPHETWFEQIQEKVVDVLKNDDLFYPAFKKSPGYVKMLLELEIIDEDRNESTLSASESMTSLSSFDRSDDSSFRKPSIDESTPVNIEGESVMTAVVETLGIGHQGKQTYALYNVRVSRSVNGQEVSGWNVIRRYSDFHTLHSFLIQKYPKLVTLSFPGKKTFNNLDSQFLEKRTKALNMYMECILQPSMLRNYTDMDKVVFDFLSQKKYANNDPLTKKVMSAMFDPIKNGVKAVGSTVMAVPDQVFEGVSKVGAGINSAAKTLINPISQTSNPRAPTMETDRVAASLSDTESENIPLRVLVLVVNEVFGSQGSAWFRRQVVTVIRHIVTPFGTSINKRIVDIVNWLTSEQQVCGYLNAFKNSMWPNGKLGGEYPEKPVDFHHRCHVLAKTLMLSSLPDELRIILGANISYRGINTISEAFQNKHLNRRLLYVLFERLLIKVFPQNRFEKTFAQLHSKSPRTKKM